MKQTRLDGVLARNRKNLVVDLALAALFPMALLLSGMAVGTALSAAPAAAPSAPATADANTDQPARDLG